jgi:hypothetical protein
MFRSLDNPCDASCVIVKDNVGWAFHFASGLLSKCCLVAIRNPGVNLTDLVFVLPLVYINRLNMSKTQRISTAIIFCLGFINLCIALARWFIVQSVFSPSPSLPFGGTFFLLRYFDPSKLTSLHRGSCRFRRSFRVDNLHFIVTPGVPENIPGRRPRDSPCTPHQYQY